MEKVQERVKLKLKELLKVYAAVGKLLERASLLLFTTGVSLHTSKIAWPSTPTHMHCPLALTSPCFVHETWVTVLSCAYHVCQPKMNNRTPTEHERGRYCRTADFMRSRLAHFSLLRAACLVFSRLCDYKGYSMTSGGGSRRHSRPRCSTGQESNTLGAALPAVAHLRTERIEAGSNLPSHRSLSRPFSWPHPFRPLLRARPGSLS